MSSNLGFRYYTPNPFEIDATGLPINGAQLFFYLTQTSTPLDTYSDAAMTIPNTNPVVAIADGHYGNIFLTQQDAYKVACYGPNPDPAVPSTPASPQGTLLWTADPVGPGMYAGQQNVLGMLGEVRDFAGISTMIPAQWYLCYGQAVSRTTYAAAFAVIGTTWGAGDGSTTFNLPDLRGRVTLGKDDMGGTAAGRVTSGVGGINGASLGGTGGSQYAQRDTLTATTGVTISDPGHTHTPSTPGGNLLETQNPGNQINGGGFGTITTLAPAATGITATATTTVTSGLTGTCQNVQPGAVVNKIIFLGA